MLKQSDIEGRLRLFRYGIVVVIVTSFIVSMIAPIVLTAKLPIEYRIGLFDALLPATIIALMAGLIGFMAYFAYSQAIQSRD